MDVARSRKKEIVASSMHLITMNRQTKISGHHGMHSFMPSLYLHEISQLGGIDGINDNHELHVSRGTKKKKNSNKYKKQLNKIEG